MSKYVTKAINFKNCETFFINKKYKTEKRDRLIYSDMDFYQNARDSFFLFGEEKTWGKDFSTGIHTYTKENNEGPLRRAKSFVDAFKNDRTVVYVFVWSKKRDVNLEECYVKQFYYKKEGDDEGKMKVFDTPINYVEWKAKFCHWVGMIDNKEYNRLLIKSNRIVQNENCKEH